MQTTWADPMAPVSHRVSRMRRETYDTFTLELTPAAGASGACADCGPVFAPGQFNMLYAFGVGEVPISISGDPADPGKIVHTVRAVGAVTRALTNRKRTGVLGLRGPFGTPWPLDQVQGKDVVVVAGGIGLAPLRPAIYHLLRIRDRVGRIALLYGARTPADILYRKELQAWRSRLDVDVQVTVDKAAASWRGHVGVVVGLLPKAVFDSGNAVAMVCGPEVMIRFTLAALEKRGMKPEQIYVSMERNMQCAVGVCGHCQFGPYFVCKDGPVFRYDRIQRFFGRPEV